MVRTFSIAGSAFCFFFPMPKVYPLFTPGQVPKISGKTVNTILTQDHPQRIFSIYKRGEIMEAREERGIVIAALCKLKKEGHHWLVPSQTGRPAVYRVDPDHKTCTCPDYLDRQEPCKHVYAVQ